jgi:excisionase family DNA binding protein
MNFILEIDAEDGNEELIQRFLQKLLDLHCIGYHPILRIPRGIIDTRTEDLPNLLTTVEAAKILGVTPRTILNWIAAKKVRCLKYGERSFRLYKEEILIIAQFGMKKGIL